MVVSWILGMCPVAMTTKEAMGRSRSRATGAVERSAEPRPATLILEKAKPRERRGKAAPLKTAWLSFARNWVLSLLQAQNPRGKSWLTVAAGSRPLAYVSSQSNGIRPRNTKAGISGQPLPNCPDQPPVGFVGFVKTSPGLRAATAARMWEWLGLTARRWIAGWGLAPLVMRQPCPARLVPLHDKGPAKHMKGPRQRSAPCGMTPPR